MDEVRETERELRTRCDDFPLDEKGETMRKRTENCRTTKLSMYLENYRCLESEPAELLLELDLPAELDVLVGRRSSDEDLVLAGRGDPLAVVLVEVGEGLLADRELDLLRLAGFESDLLESLELLDGRGDAAAVRSGGDEDLSDLSTVDGTGVLDGEGDGEVTLGGDGGGREGGELERGVGETVAEGEGGGEARAVVVAVADVDTLREGCDESVASRKEKKEKKTHLAVDNLSGSLTGVTE
jgi:hypothetical protein